jgi:hypothetical protein
MTNLNDETMKELQPVPFIAYEAVQIRGDVREQRLHSINRLLVILLVAFFVASCAVMYFIHKRDMQQIADNNKRWIAYMEQYDFADYEYNQDGQGVNIMGDRNGVDYYVAEAESKNPD